MKRLLGVVTIAALLSASPALAQQFFDFDGQAHIPGSVGGNADMCAFVLNSGTEPLPLDFDNFEYTIVITNLELTADGFTQSYAGGDIVLYEDASTPADYSNKSTFTDGTALLIGTVTSFSRTIFFPSSGNGTGNGLVDWTGGSEIDEIHPSDRLNWALLVNILGTSGVEPGFDERWDGKVEPQTPIVATEDSSFSDIKSRY